MFDIDRALERLLCDDAAAPDVAGVPRHESTRSVAAARCARAASREGLRLFHFEHRALLEVPADWQRTAAEGALPSWDQGVLPEPKYGAFRHDQGIGSFHPGHRAKWSAHELCHGLVGTAWHPGASPLFHATAGRLAEVVPVALWYFLDELGLRRCVRHRGPLFRTHCPDCEERASRGAGPVDEERARRLLVGARDYVSQELDAVEATLSAGLPVHHVHGSLDLCSDGLAYAASHGPRLDSPGFAAFAERYLPEMLGGYRDLEGLRDRAVRVFLHLATGDDLPDRGARAADWVRQDLAGRVLQGLHGDAGACSEVWDRLDVDDLEGAIRTYAEVSDALGGQHPADVFAPGYDLLEGVGRSVEQVEEGLRSVVPVTMQLADDAEMDLVEDFVFDEVPARRPLGLRFADWLVDRAAPHVVALARYEAMLRAAGGEADLASLSGDGWRWAHGVQRWQGSFDPVSWAEVIDGGSVEGELVDDRLSCAPPPTEPTSLAMGRSAEGELLLVSTPSGDVADWDAPVRRELLALGLLVPASFHL